MQLLVIGMHRSGTSMVTRILSLMGAYLSTEADGSGIVYEENPKRLWEQRDVRRVNERMLADAGGDWDRVTPWLAQPWPRKPSPHAEKELLALIGKLEPHRPWVIEDPCLCLTLSAWLPRLEMPHVLMPLRNPLEVAYSLQYRNGFPLDVGLALWEAYMLQALRPLPGHHVHVLRHEELIADPIGVSGRLHRALRLQGTDTLTVAKEDELRAFIELARSRSRVPDLGSHYLDHPALALYSRMCATDPRELGALCGELSARSAEELAAHERRSRKAKAAAASSWLELRDQLLETIAKEPDPATVTVSTVARIENEIALTSGRAIERCRELRAEISQLQEQRRTAEEHVTQLEARSPRRQQEIMAFDSRHQAELQRREAPEGQLFVRASELDRARRLHDAVREAKQTQSAQESELESMRRVLVSALGDDAEAKAPIGLLVDRAVQRLAVQSALVEHARHTEQADKELRGLVRQMRALRVHAKSLLVHYKAIDAAGRQINREMEGLQASRSWRLVNRLMRVAERLVGRTPVWTARHQSLKGALKRMRDRTSLGHEEVSRLSAQARTVLEDSKAAARQTEVIARSIGQLSANAVFERHLALIIGGRSHELLRKRYQETQIHPDVRRRLMRERPLVSIVLPTYNRAALIGDAIASVLEQTYSRWELLVCDDGSTDDTEARVQALGERRIRFLSLKHRGAAAARNAGLAEARGRYIAYLDTDNLWHPEYLMRVVGALVASPGHLSAYADYLDVECKGGRYKLRANRVQSFCYEDLSEKNFIDLNAFVHDAALLRVVGGFTESLIRQQDWDLVLKIAYLRDPLMVDLPLMMYRRNHEWQQITVDRKADTGRSAAQVHANVASYYSGSLSRRSWIRPKPKLTVLGWDVCRNHFSKAYNLAEAAQQSFDPQLVGFYFFGPNVFEPYRDERPSFRTEYLDGTQFPEFFSRLTQAWARIDGSAIYCVKPRLPSLGLALLANYHTGVPVILESNDNEAHVSDPQRHAGNRKDLSLDDCSVEDLLNPYGDAWSQVMDGYANEMPIVVTHNRNLDAHHGGGGYYLRNLKDEAYYDPERYDRDAIRSELGFSPEDRVILFGGLLRKHKGIYELIELVRSLGDPRYKLLFVGSRISPDQERFVREHAAEIKVLPPQGRNRMAEINLAADLVVLWLDPGIPASHYQMPYKFTDAIAMRVPVIANDISDLGPLARRGYLRLAEFGDFAALRDAVRATFDNQTATGTMAHAARQLYLRQFSYAASNTMLKMLYEHADAQRGVLPVAERFARDFARFRQRVEHHFGGPMDKAGAAI